MDDQLLAWDRNLGGLGGSVRTLRFRPTHPTEVTASNLVLPLERMEGRVKTGEIESVCVDRKYQSCCRRRCRCDEKENRKKEEHSFRDVLPEYHIPG